MLKDIASGAGYFVQGLKSMFAPHLRTWVMLPLLLNVLVMGGASYFAIDRLGEWLGQLQAWLPDWLSWLYWLLMPVFAIAVLVLVGYVFSSVLSVIASPLNGLLSERVEAASPNFKSPPSESVGDLIKRTFSREITKIKYYLPRYVIILVVTLIPGMNAVSPFVWLWFGGWMLAIQYVDYSYDFHARSFKDVIASEKKHRFMMVGFGIVVALMLTVPVLNWFVMPAAVIGGTLMRLEKMPI